MTVAQLASVLVLVCICFVSDSHARSYGGSYGSHTRSRRPSWGVPNTRQPYEAESTVILTHVIFRHGNRTGQLSEIYPRDPYLNYTYFPFGRGQLTNAGKLREYNIGRELRSRYNRFLGDYFYPEIVDAVSTDFNRTKASLLLVLASLFPPRKESVWNNDFNWQPVPYNYQPPNRDPVLLGLNCPAYTRRLEELKRTNKWQAEFNRNKRVFDYVSKNTGLNVQTYKEIYDLYFGLSTEEEWGHILPQWTRSVWPNIITDLAIKNYYMETATTELIKYAEGFHLKKIIEDTRTKIRNINVEPGRKIYLYSAHENNIAEMLITLNVFSPPHVPTYGSYLILEVHNINNVIGIKIFYQRYVTQYPVLLKIPACDEFCPLDRFQQLFEEFLPASEDLCYRN